MRHTRTVDGHRSRDRIINGIPRSRRLDMDRRDLLRVRPSALDGCIRQFSEPRDPSGRQFLVTIPPGRGGSLRTFPPSWGRFLKIFSPPRGRDERDSDPPRPSWPRPGGVRWHTGRSRWWRSGRRCASDCGCRSCASCFAGATACRCPTRRCTTSPSLSSASGAPRPSHATPPRGRASSSASLTRSSAVHGCANAAKCRDARERPTHHPHDGAKRRVGCAGGGA